MAPDKPALLLVPGAWHLPGPTFSSTIPLLHSSGYTTSAVSLASNGAAKSVSDPFSLDVERVRAALATLIDEQGKDVVLVMHSYGGMPGSQGCERFAKADR
jgi:pimeloyl-ACP methyl ester carboxylesterase